jgi:hypothetical protein
MAFPAYRPSSIGSASKRLYHKFYLAILEHRLILFHVKETKELSMKTLAIPITEEEPERKRIEDSKYERS